MEMKMISISVEPPQSITNIYIRCPLQWLVSNLNPRKGPLSNFARIINISQGVFFFIHRKMPAPMAGSVSSTEKKIRGAFGRPMDFVQNLKRCASQGNNLSGHRSAWVWGGGEEFDRVDKMVRHHLLSPSKRYNSSLSLSRSSYFQ